MIASEVARNYFLLRSYDLQTEVIQDTNSPYAEEALKLQKSRFDGGMANEMDVPARGQRAGRELARADLAGAGTAARQC